MFFRIGTENLRGSKTALLVNAHFILHRIDSMSSLRSCQLVKALLALCRQLRLPPPFRNSRIGVFCKINVSKTLAQIPLPAMTA